jgi:hypothetical protein
MCYASLHALVIGRGKAWGERGHQESCSENNERSATHAAFLGCDGVWQESNAPSNIGILACSLPERGVLYT